MGEEVRAARQRSALTPWQQKRRVYREELVRLMAVLSKEVAELRAPLTAQGRRLLDDHLLLAMYVLMPGQPL